MRAPATTPPCRDASARIASNTYDGASSDETTCTSAAAWRWGSRHRTLAPR
jgi:hypothetical protein